MKAFLMAIYCVANSHTCTVEYQRAIYPTAAECAQVAPNWLENMREFEKRKPVGMLCEISNKTPHNYRVPRSQVP